MDFLSPVSRPTVTGTPNSCGNWRVTSGTSDRTLTSRTSPFVTTTRVFIHPKATGEKLAKLVWTVIPHQCSPRAHQILAQPSPGPCTPSPARAQPVQIHNEVAQARPGRSKLINHFKHKTAFFLILKLWTAFCHICQAWIFMMGMNIGWLRTFSNTMNNRGKASGNWQPPLGILACCGKGRPLYKNKSCQSCHAIASR